MKQIYDAYFPASQEYPSFTDIRKSVSLIFCNHHSLSEGPIAPLLPGIIEIGGIEINQIPYKTDMLISPHIDLTTLDIIYFSFGSKIKWSRLPKTFQEMFTEAFKAFSNYTILWKYDMNCTELELKFPLSNVKCKQWWPQSSILASKQIKLFITHGGKGSISGALYHGVPLLGISFFGDQRANIDKMSEKQFGLKLNAYNITVENLIKTMQTLLKNDTYQKNIQQFSSLYNDRPISNKLSVIYWVEYVLRYKGAKHLQSSALDLNFYEYYSLDIFLLILVFVWALILFLNLLERQLSI